jgi:hypothetical protein
MTFLTFLLLFVSAAIAIPVIWLWIVHPVVLRRRDRIRRAARRRTPVAELLTETKAALRSEGWQRFKTGESILLLDSSCTERRLYTLLKALWLELSDDDRQNGRSGRESNYFELHDCGMVELIEELQRRVGDTNPFSWNVRG